MFSAVVDGAGRRSCVTSSLRLAPKNSAQALKSGKQSFIDQLGDAQDDEAFDRLEIDRAGGGGPGGGGGGGEDHRALISARV